MQDEIKLIKIVTKFSKAAHICLPKAWIGHTVMVILGRKAEPDDYSARYSVNTVYPDEPENDQIEGVHVTEPEREEAGVQPETTHEVSTEPIPERSG